MTKILVVEDDPHTRAALEDVLRAESYNVVTAADGKVAMELFRHELPDLVCLDVMLPFTSGYDLCRTFRQSRPEIPVLFITAKSEEIDRVVGLELGGDDYIVKPFGIREVVARVRAVLRRCGSDHLPAEKAATDEKSFWLLDLEVLPLELRARREGKLIELSVREVELLVLFHQRRGQVLTRAEIFHQLWGLANCPNSRTLDQHISQLRRRIERDPRHPQIIQTVHGAGYRFDG